MIAEGDSVGRKVLAEMNHPERYPNSKIPSTQARNRGEYEDK